jgi:hypothetical protein
MGAPLNWLLEIEPEAAEMLAETPAIALLAASPA